MASVSHSLWKIGQKIHQISVKMFESGYRKKNMMLEFWHGNKKNLFFLMSILCFSLNKRNQKFLNVRHLKAAEYKLWNWKNYNLNQTTFLNQNEVLKDIFSIFCTQVISLMIIREYSYCFGTYVTRFNLWPTR